METSPMLADRVREVFLNGTWIANTNYKDLLTGLDREQANRKIGSLNSIARLTYHINYYLAGLIKVFKGGSLDIRDQFSFNMPEICSDGEWRKLLNDFLENAETFAGYVEQMPAEQLEGYFVDKKYGTYRRNIEGVIEHGYYHLGQVSLIRKMIEEQNE